MTYKAWRNHCVEVVKAPMTIEQLRHDCGRLASAEPPNPEVILMHAMLALELLLKDADQKELPMTRSLEAMARQCIADDWDKPCPGYYRDMNITSFAALVRAQALEEAAAWLESQRADIPAHGWEFAAAIRSAASSSNARSASTAAASSCASS